MNGTVFLFENISLFLLVPGPRGAMNDGRRQIDDGNTRDERRRVPLG
jgi:hypothetical protein